MRLYKALVVAEDCGLETVGEAVFNIRIHAQQIFSYYQMSEELDELNKEYEFLLNTVVNGNRLVLPSDSVKVIKNLIHNEKYDLKYKVWKKNTCQ